MELINKIASILGVDGLQGSENSELNSVNTLQKGIRVCFTGSAYDTDGNPILREQLEEWAVQFELIPVSSVTKKSCDLLIVADKSSMSGKTKKARDFGINVISVSEFLQLIVK